MLESCSLSTTLLHLARWHLDQSKFITTMTSGPVNKKVFALNCSLIALAFCILAPESLSAQTFEIGGQSSQPTQQSTVNKGKSRTPSQAFSASEGNGLQGFGAGIEYERLARKAEDELKHGNYSAASDYTKRALQSAPGNADLWFMLGYSSRLAGRLSDSLNAYQEGLK